MLSVSTMSGTAKCGKPAGSGSATGTYTETPKIPNVKIAGSGSLLPPGPFSGKFKITKATGKLKKAHGSGTINCTQSVLTLTCKQKLTKGSL